MSFWSVKRPEIKELTDAFNWLCILWYTKRLRVELRGGASKHKTFLNTPASNFNNFLKAYLKLFR